MSVFANGAKGKELEIDNRLQDNLRKIYQDNVEGVQARIKDNIPPQNRATDSSTEKDTGKLHPGAIAAIVVAVVVVLIIILCGITFFVTQYVILPRRRMKEARVALDGIPEFLNTFKNDIDENDVESLIQEIDRRWQGGAQKTLDITSQSGREVILSLENIQGRINVGLTPTTSRAPRYSLFENGVPYENFEGMFAEPESIQPNFEAQLVITNKSPFQYNLDFQIDVDRDIKLVKLIGSGAFGTVYKGIWTKRKTGEKLDVAVKFMNQGILDEITGPHSRLMLKTFKEELALVAKMRHPNIVGCYGGCLQPPRLAIVLEFMSGGNLHNYIHDCRGSLSYIDILRIMAHIAAGLNYLHPSILHRDLKPKNVLIDANGVPKISDFGLSKLRNHSVTMTMNQVKGTPQYMAPEAWTGQSVLTEKSDIYALGIIAWEMLTGQRPWSQCVNQLRIVGIRTKSDGLEQGRFIGKFYGIYNEKVWESDIQK
eukprot:TRINITY_DN56190_c0_g2_i3.p1 TRINITY_DN56190_c0_g2~~TRINITY_DN56190_c0_g2_i3.p1  ORF type:complete len:484 (-),score=44.14 TRINITY_DN56190_c0_g2_i3:484-1935(-)